MLEAFRRGARAPEALGVGPGLPFAGELYRLTWVPIGLLPCALGGSSLEQWNPALKGEGGRSLYGAMLRRIAAVGGRVRGVLWYQGESDATVEMGPTYRRRFADFIRAVRKDVKDPGLPVLFVQIGRFIVPPDSLPQGWDLVREGQRRVEADLDHVAVVPAVDASLVDLIHLDTAGQIKVGRRLARAAAREVFGRQEFSRGPRLAEVKTNADRTAVTVAFGEVNGRLRAEGRPTGFVISDGAGEPIPIITRVDLPEESPTAVVLRLGQPLPEGSQLWYGRGLDPYVNLTDDRDMGMLAFGPVPIPYPAV
jgi:sialate O-acetylesterase